MSQSALYVVRKQSTIYPLRFTGVRTVRSPLFIFLQQLKKVFPSLEMLALRCSSDIPVKESVTRQEYRRNAIIAAYAKRRANGICQLCLKAAPFKTPEGEPYLEVHHIEWLMNGGSDSVENTVALCPNCHRKMHSLNLPEDVRKLKEYTIKK